MELTYEGYKLCNFFDVVEAPKSKDTKTKDYKKSSKKGDVVVLCSINNQNNVQKITKKA